MPGQNKSIEFSRMLHQSLLQPFSFSERPSEDVCTDQIQCIQRNNSDGSFERLLNKLRDSEGGHSARLQGQQQTSGRVKSQFARLSASQGGKQHRGRSEAEQRDHNSLMSSFNPPRAPAPSERSFSSYHASHDDQVKDSSRILFTPRNDLSQVLEQSKENGSSIKQKSIGSKSLRSQQESINSKQGIQSEQNPSLDSNQRAALNNAQVMEYNHRKSSIHVASKNSSFYNQSLQDLEEEDEEEEKLPLYQPIQFNQFDLRFSLREEDLDDPDFLEVPQDEAANSAGLYSFLKDEATRKMRAEKTSKKYVFTNQPVSPIVNLFEQLLEAKENASLQQDKYPHDHAKSLSSGKKAFHNNFASRANRQQSALNLQNEITGNKKTESKVDLRKQDKLQLKLDAELKEEQRQQPKLVQHYSNSKSNISKSKFSEKQEILEESKSGSSQRASSMHSAIKAENLIAAAEPNHPSAQEMQEKKVVPEVVGPRQQMAQFDQNFYQMQELTFKPTKYSHSAHVGMNYPQEVAALYPPASLSRLSKKEKSEARKVDLLSDFPRQQEFNQILPVFLLLPERSKSMNFEPAKVRKLDSKRHAKKRVKKKAEKSRMINEQNQIESIQRSKSLEVKSNNNQQEHIQPKIEIATMQRNSEKHVSRFYNYKFGVINNNQNKEQNPIEKFEKINESSQKNSTKNDLLRSGFLKHQSNQ